MGGVRLLRGKCGRLPRRRCRRSRSLAPISAESVPPSCIPALQAPAVGMLNFDWGEIARGPTCPSFPGDRPWRYAQKRRPRARDRAAGRQGKNSGSDLLSHTETVTAPPLAASISRRLARSVDPSRSADASAVWLFMGEHAGGGPGRTRSAQGGRHTQVQRFSVPGMQFRMVSPEQAGAPEKISPESRCRPSSWRSLDLDSAQMSRGVGVSWRVASGQAAAGTKP